MVCLILKKIKKSKASVMWQMRMLATVINLVLSNITTSTSSTLTEIQPNTLDFKEEFMVPQETENPVLLESH